MWQGCSCALDLIEDKGGATFSSIATALVPQIDHGSFDEKVYLVWSLQDLSRAIHPKMNRWSAVVISLRFFSFPKSPCSLNVKGQLIHRRLYNLRFSEQTSSVLCSSLWSAPSLGEICLAKSVFVVILDLELSGTAVSIASRGHLAWQDTGPDLRNSSDGFSSYGDLGAICGSALFPTMVMWLWR